MGGCCVKRGWAGGKRSPQRNSGGVVFIHKTTPIWRGAINLNLSLNFSSGGNSGKAGNPGWVQAGKKESVK